MSSILRPVAVETKTIALAKSKFNLSDEKS